MTSVSRMGDNAVILGNLGGLGRMVFIDESDSGSDDGRVLVVGGGSGGGLSDDDDVDEEEDDDNDGGEADGVDEEAGSGNGGSESEDCEALVLRSSSESGPSGVDSVKISSRISSRKAVDSKRR